MGRIHVREHSRGEYFDVVDEILKSGKKFDYFHNHRGMSCLTFWQEHFSKEEIHYFMKECIDDNPKTMYSIDKCHLDILDVHELVKLAIQKARML